MYNHLLDTLITVIDCVSFTKASEHLFMSPTAVRKQINSLENQLNMALVERTATGVKLTSAGRIIYRDAKFMKNYSKKSIAEARAAEQYYDTIFCVETGNVLLTTECWKDVHHGLVTIPVERDYSIPYGLLYSMDAPDDVLRFVEKARELSKS